MLFSLLAFTLTERGFASTNTRENNTQKSEENSSGCLVSYGFMPRPMFPYSPFPLALSHPQHLPSFPSHGDVPYFLAVSWGSGPSCLRALHVLPAQLIATFSSG